MTRQEFEAAVKAVWPDAKVSVHDYGAPSILVRVERQTVTFRIEILAPEQKAMAAALAAVRGAQTNA